MPYDGLFLPYQDRWENLGPINGGLAKYNVTYDMINAYYRDLQVSRCVGAWCCCGCGGRGVRGGDTPNYFPHSAREYMLASIYT